jgi:receptor protein-tyrosine kinase
MQTAMNIIQQATKRLEELQRAGVDVPWAAAGFKKPPVAESAEGDIGNAAVAVQPTPHPAAPVPQPVAQAPEPAVAAAERRSEVVELDLDRLARMGYCVPANARMPLSEEFRILKRPLLKNAALEGEAAIRRGNLIMVTSSLAGEGKTFTSLNLALSISAEVDRSVLLVDADVIRPSVLERLGLSPRRGLMDVLRDPSVDLSDVMLRTNIPKLSVLPSGEGSVHATEMLASAAMQRLLDDLATKYADRIVIFDAPPLLMATESHVLATHMGQVVVVVEAGNTSRHAVSEAFASVAHCPVVLPLLNKYSGPNPMGGYGYY